MKISYGWIVVAAGALMGCVAIGIVGRPRPAA